MTFSTAAAAEFADRITAVMAKHAGSSGKRKRSGGNDSMGAASDAMEDRVAASTFHSFCLKLCRKYHQLLGVNEVCPRWPRTKTTVLFIPVALSDWRTLFVSMQQDFVVFTQGQQRRAITDAMHKYAESVEKDKAGSGTAAVVVSKKQAENMVKFVTRCKSDGVVGPSLSGERKFVFDACVSHKPVEGQSAASLQRRPRCTGHTKGANHI